MEGLSLEALGGVLVAVVVALVLWKILKIAVKVVLFVVVALVLAAGVAVFLKEGRVGLPVEAPARDALPASVPPR